MQIQGTEYQIRIEYLERELRRQRGILDSANNLAKKSAQDLARGIGGGGGGGGNDPKLAYFPGGISGLVGNAPGTGTFQFVNNVADHLTATGDPADSNQTAKNITSGSTSSAAYGIVWLIDGEWWAFVDCGSGATAPITAMVMDPVMVGRGSSSVGGFGVPTGAFLAVGAGSSSVGGSAVSAGLGDGFIPTGTTPIPP